MFFTPPVPATTAEAIEHFSKGIDILRNVHETQTDVADVKREEAARLDREADIATDDAAHAARIIERFENFVS